MEAKNELNEIENLENFFEGDEGNESLDQNEKNNKSNFFISSYQFSDFSSSSSSIIKKSKEQFESRNNHFIISESHENSHLNKVLKRETLSSDEILEEKEFADRQNFIIHPAILRERETARYQHEVREQRIEEEVLFRLAKVREESYQEGLETGKREGREAVFDHYNNDLKKRMNDLNVFFDQIKKKYDDVINHQKKEILFTYKSLLRWILIKEIKSDDDYLLRLIKKVTDEIKEKSEYVIVVSPTDYEKVEKYLKNEGSPKNSFTIEVNPDLQTNEIKIDHHNFLVDQSLEKMIQQLDELLADLNFVSDNEESP